MNTERGFGRFVCEDHSTIARKVAEEGIVLLKNENKILPIPVGKHKKIAVIGENAIRNLTAGGGSSELKVKYEISPLEGLKAKYGNENIRFSYGYSAGPNTWGKVVDSKLDKDSMFRAAVETAKNADIVLFIGGLNKSWFQETEGADRTSFNLPYNQDELLLFLVIFEKYLESFPHEPGKAPVPNPHALKLSHNYMAEVVGRRLAKCAGVDGFGNARDVRNFVATVAKRNYHRR
jgi:hypothetical protein